MSMYRKIVGSNAEISKFITTTKNDDPVTMKLITCDDLCFVPEFTLQSFNKVIDKFNTPVLIWKI